MSKGCLIGLVVLGIIILVGGLFVGTIVGKYNHLVSLDENCEKAWANVQTVLQRRYDLIPNLVNTVKGFAKQEREVLEEVTRLRSQWAQANTETKQSQVASRLEGALGRLMVISERYPELKSNQNFLALQDELAGTENRISVERRRYNEAVQMYNTAIRRVPGRFIAGIAGFDRREPFQAVSGAESAPTVEF